MKRITAVVTGGGGFVGSNLAERLVFEGFNVRVVDDFSTGDATNLATLRGDIDLIEGSVLDSALVRGAFDGAQVIFHQAAVPSVARSVANPRRSHDANVTGTVAVLEAAREAGVGKVVYASSSSIYGGAHPLPVREDMEPRPVSPYAVSKLSGEYYCRCYTATFGLPTVSLRYFNVFGPRQSPDSDYAAVIPRFAQSLLRGEQIHVYGDGRQSRDFTFIDNVVDANLLAAMATGEAVGRAYNIASGTRFTLLEVLDQLALLAGRPSPQISFEPERQGDVRHSQADISAAQTHLGYEVGVPFDLGLKQTFQWLGGALGSP
jgi:nucleoside-diphosphate-sugar epimerase